MQKESIIVIIVIGQSPPAIDACNRSRKMEGVIIDEHAFIVTDWRHCNGWRAELQPGIPLMNVLSHYLMKNIRKTLRQHLIISLLDKILNWSHITIWVPMKRC